MRKLLSSFLLLGALAAANAQHDETFIVRIHDSYTQVLSPEKRQDKLHLILENKTVGDLVVMLEVGERQAEFLSVKGGKTKAKRLPLKKSEQLSLRPLSPPGETIELKFGQKTYEIPPQSGR